MFITNTQSAQLLEKVVRMWKNHKLNKIIEVGKIMFLFIVDFEFKSRLIEPSGLEPAPLTQMLTYKFVEICSTPLARRHGRVSYLKYK